MENIIEFFRCTILLPRWRKRREYLKIINVLLNNLYVVMICMSNLFDKSSTDNLYNIGNQSIFIRARILQSKQKNRI